MQIFEIIFIIELFGRKLQNYRRAFFLKDMKIQNQSIIRCIDFPSGTRHYYVAFDKTARWLILSAKKTAICRDNGDLRRIDTLIEVSDIEYLARER